jgi:hypothetical protein
MSTAHRNHSRRFGLHLAAGMLFAALAVACDNAPLWAPGAGTQHIEQSSACTEFKQEIEACPDYSGGAPACADENGAYFECLLDTSVDLCTLLYHPEQLTSDETAEIASCGK